MMRHMLIAVVAVTMLRTSAGSSDFGFPTTIGGAISDWTLQMGVEMEVWSHNISSARGR